MSNKKHRRDETPPCDGCPIVLEMTVFERVDLP